MTRRYLVALLASIALRFEAAAQSLNGDVVRLRPTALPTKCNTGDLRVNTSGNIFSFCLNNSWSRVDNETAPFAGTASYAVSAGTATFAATSGTASFATSAGSALTASTAGTAAFAAAATTASTAGTAAAAASLTATLGVSGGGTGLTSVTANTVLLGDGTNPLVQLAPGGSGTVLVGSTTPSFTGTPLGLLGVGINDTSSGAALYVRSVNTSSVTLAVKALANQTADMIQVLDSNGSAQMVFSSGGNFKFFHNVTPGTTRFDVRGSISQSTVNSGNNARYNAFFADPTALAANVGAGIALGGRNTTAVGSETPYGYIWVNKDTASAGDVAGSLHLATRNNSTGLVQRALELDSSGNADFFGDVNVNGTSGKVSIQVQPTAGTWNFNLPTSAGTLGQVLQSGAGGTVAMTWVSKIPTSQVFTTGTAATYTAPGTVPMTLKVTLIGAGGGAGGSASGAAQASAGAGGGGGGMCIGFINTTGGTTYTYTVGAGGSGGVSNTNGTAGTATTFNNFTASAGSGGAGAGGSTLADNIGGVGGVGSGCTANIRGGPGGTGLVLSAAIFVSGTGGNAPLGGGAGAVSGNSNGNAGENYGGGGGGSSSTGGGGANNGGAGANGLIVVEEYQ